MQNLTNYWNGTQCFKTELNIAKAVVDKYIKSESTLPIQDWIGHELRFNALPDNGISTTKTTYEFSNVVESN